MSIRTHAFINQCYAYYGIIKVTRAFDRETTTYTVNEVHIARESFTIIVES